MKLNHLNDQTLLLKTKSLVQEEREILSHVLWHLKEIDQRKLYANEKCGSLFDYCVKVLKYSEGQASRRVTASRLLKDLPEIAPQIERGDLNLTQLNQAKHFFHEENITSKSQKKEVIKQLVGLTTRESEKLLWSLKSEDSPRKVTITISETAHEKLKVLQALKAHTCPDLDTLIIKACDELQTIWSPSLQVSKRNSKMNHGLNRYITKQDKVLIWKRDQGKCQNCGSIYALELDHIKPFAKGGESKKENLQLLCRNCNQRKSLENFGKFNYATCLNGRTFD